MSTAANNRKSLLSLLNSNNFCTYNRKIAAKIGMAEAILLGEIVSKHEFFEERDQLIEIKGDYGFFYMTVEQIEERTGMKKDMALTARKGLIAKNLIETRDHGIPCRKYYRINEENIEKMINELRGFKEKSARLQESSNKMETCEKNECVSNKVEEILQQACGIPPTGHYIEEKQEEKHKEGYTEAGASPPPPAPSHSSSKEKEPPKNPHGELGNVRLTRQEHEKLKERIGEAATDLMVKRLDLYLGQTGKSYKSHYAAILNWFNKDQEEKAKNATEVIAKHRQGSKLAIETKTDTWKPKYGWKEESP